MHGQQNIKKNKIMRSMYNNTVRHLKYRFPFYINTNKYISNIAVSALWLWRYMDNVWQGTALGDKLEQNNLYKTTYSKQTTLYIVLS